MKKASSQKQVGRLEGPAVRSLWVSPGGWMVMLEVTVIYVRCFVQALGNHGDRLPPSLCSTNSTLLCICIHRTYTSPLTSNPAHSHVEGREDSGETLQRGNLKATGLWGCGFRSRFFRFLSMILDMSHSLWEPQFLNL